MLAFGYPDDIFFTYREEVVPPRCGNELIRTGPAKPVLILRGVAAEDRDLRRAARRAVRSVRRDLAACRPELYSTANAELAVVHADGGPRVRVIDSGQLDASEVERVSRALVRASWPSRARAGLRVYLRWSVVENVRDPKRG